MENVEQTIISQYANSPTIVQLIQNMNQYIDPSIDFQNFYNYVWNVNTAQGFGLDIWGRIVNVGRNLNIPLTTIKLGFNTTLKTYESFGHGSFNAGTQSTTVYTLADNAYKRLILAKALANISATNSHSINQILQNFFFGRGRCYVNDLGGMAMRYVFEFSLMPYELAIVTQSGVFPRPAGVNATLINPPQNVLGFNGTRANSFGHGAFMDQRSVYVVN